MRTVVRFAALVGLGVLAAAAPPSARGADAPPRTPAGPTGLTDADRAFFAWWDAKGFPDVTKLPFVTLDEAERRLFRADTGNEPPFPAGAFLMGDDGKVATLFLTDLQIVRRPLKSAMPKDANEDAFGWERGVEYRKADLAAWAKEGLALALKEGPEIPWFRKADPFGAHRWSIPNQAFRIAVVARALAGRGEDELARRMCDRALHEATRPMMPEQYGDDDPSPRASYDAIESEIRHEASVILESGFGDPRLSWEDLLAAHEAWTRGFAPDRRAPPDDAIALLRRAIGIAQAQRSRPPVADRPPATRIAMLIEDLQDVSTSYWDESGRRAKHDGPDDAPRPADVELLALRFEAVPALIEALDDVRFTRSHVYYPSFKGQFRDSFRVLRVGELAWQILDELSSTALRATEAGGPPTTGRPSRRRAAEEWFADVRARGEQAVLVDEVAKGAAHSGTAATRLVALDAEVAVRPIEIGIVVGDERSGRESLVDVLAALPSAAAQDAMIRLLGPLRVSEPGITLAASLWSRGRREGLDALIRWWDESPPTQEHVGSWIAPFRDRPTGEILTPPVGTGHPDAIRALAAGIAAQPPRERVEIVRALRPTGGPAWKETYARPMSADAEPIIEALLAERLSDAERAYGHTVKPDGVGDQPIVGEMAAWVLAQRYPSRWSFDAASSVEARDAARIELANRWRTAHGQTLLATKRPAIALLPPERTQPLLRAWLDAADDNARDVAGRDLVAAGLGALPAIVDARDALKAGDPRRETLELVVRRLACTTREIRWSPSSAKPNAALVAYVDAVKGKPMTGPWITGLWRQVAVDAPHGVTGIDFTFERPGDGTGGVLTLELVQGLTPWGGGDGGWVLAGNGWELVDDAFVRDEWSWWHQARGPQVDAGLRVPADEPLRIRWTIKRGRG